MSVHDNNNPENVWEFFGAGGDNTMDALDPSIADGYRIVYDREVPIQIRHSLSADGRGEAPQGLSINTSTNTANQTAAGTFEAIKCKVLLLGSDDAPSAVRVELSSESDLFFQYMHVASVEEFQVIREKQRLQVDFSDYSNILIRMLNELIREPHLHVGILTLIADRDARLDFIQDVTYKYIELMSCSFSRIPSDMVEEQITYRYNTMKQRMSVVSQRLAELNALVKAKNPSLLLHLQKSPSTAGTQGLGQGLGQGGLGTPTPTSIHTPKSSR